MKDEEKLVTEEMEKNMDHEKDNDNHSNLEDSWSNCTLDVSFGIEKIHELCKWQNIFRKVQQKQKFTFLAELTEKKKTGSGDCVWPAILNVWIIQQKLEKIWLTQLL